MNLDDKANEVLEKLSKQYASRMEQEAWYNVFIGLVAHQNHAPGKAAEIADEVIQIGRLRWGDEDVPQH